MTKAAIGSNSSLVLRMAVLWLAAIIALFSLTRLAGAQACVGDCNGDGRVTIDELLISIQVELGTLPVDACPVCETVNCVVAAIGNALYGCSAEPCGTTVCIRPEFCCNPLLGICASPDAPICVY
jgi:hypothetical protein